MQTLEELDLEENNIGEKGIEYLQNNLEDHRIVIIFALSSLSFLYFFIQKVTENYPEVEYIGSENAQHLADAFRNNTVNIIIIAFLPFATSLSLYRHLSHLILAAMK